MIETIRGMLTSKDRIKRQLVVSISNKSFLPYIVCLHFNSVIFATSSLFSHFKVVFLFEIGTDSSSASKALGEHKKNRRHDLVSLGLIFLDATH
jgi:hypothetical protein